jgi:nucleotide-binding universal stress UspA family protein
MHEHQQSGDTAAAAARQAEAVFRDGRMSNLFNKILCPIDFDRNSIAALDFALRLAQECGGTIYVLGVIPTPDAQPSTTDPFPVLSEGLTTELETIARKHLEGKVPFQPLVRTGDPAHTILSVATELGVDVIVMATHGYKGVQRLLLGTVAERVVRGAEQPVITIRPRLE